MNPHDNYETIDFEKHYEETEMKLKIYMQKNVDGDYDTWSYERINADDDMYQKVSEHEQ